MGKILYLLGTTVVIGSFLLVGCDSSNKDSENFNNNQENSTEYTTQYTDVTEDGTSEIETSNKPEIDIEYTKKVIGYWAHENGSITFESDSTYFLVDNEGGESTGEYSVVASNDGLMAISLAKSKDDISVYNAELSKGDTVLTLTDELGNVIKYTKANPKEE